MASDHQSVMISVNPTTEEVLGRFPLFSWEQIDRALDEAQTGFRVWREGSFGERARPLGRAAAYLRSHQRRLASLITTEMGKPIVEAEAEIEKCARGCEYFAENAERMLAEQWRPSTATVSFVTFEPLGPVLAIMPWNFPFWQVFRAAAPALMAGNTIVVKHASNVPQCALALEEVFRAADFPEGVFVNLLISGSMADQVIADPRIAGVTLTGSGAAGRHVAAAAGSALKKTVLELGGSDPFIVLEDADLDQTIDLALRARYRNTGQSCIAAKRFVVAEAVADEFVERFTAAVRSLRVGDPQEHSTQIGPLARADLREALNRQVQESVGVGARILVGGEPLARRGYFYAPTVLADVTASMPVYREETFGPVAAIIRVGDVEEAIAVANDTTYGLGATLCTRDIEQAKHLARRIEAGSVFINGVVASDPRLPFGGVKQSGYGRELSEFGIREFTNIKMIWIGSPPTAHPAEHPTE